jgi:putative membrane protein
MFRFFIVWLLSSVALVITSKMVPGFWVETVQAALIAALVIGFLNGTLGVLLKVVTFPISVFSFGLFLLVINGMMILLASKVVPGFSVTGMRPAFWGAVVLALLGMLIRSIASEA